MMMKQAGVVVVDDDDECRRDDGGGRWKDVLLRAGIAVSNALSVSRQISTETTRLQRTPIFVVRDVKIHLSKGLTLILIFKVCTMK